MIEPVTRTRLQLAMRRLFSALSGVPLTAIVLARPTSDSPKLPETFVVVDVIAYATAVGVDSATTEWNDTTMELVETVTGLRNSSISFAAYGPDAFDVLEQFSVGLASQTSQDFLASPVVTTTPAVELNRIGLQYTGSTLNTSVNIGTSYQTSAARDITVSHSSEFVSTVGYATTLEVEQTLKDEPNPDITQTVTVTE